VEGRTLLYTVNGFYPQLSDFVTEFVKLGMEVTNFVKIGAVKAVLT